MTHELTTNGYELMLVEVPMEAKNFELIGTKDFTDLYYDVPEMEDAYIVVSNENIEPTHTVLGTITNGKADFDVEPYVEKNKFWSNHTEQLLASLSIPYANTKLVVLKNSIVLIDKK